MLTACAILMVFASTASATTLTSGSGTVVKTGTEIKSSLKTKTSSTFLDTTGLIQNTCASSTVSGKTSNETGTTVTILITVWEWQSCTRTWVLIAAGLWHISSNGTVTGSGTEFETEVPGGGHCVYGTSTGVTLGTLTNASSSTSSASLAVNAVLPLIKTVNGVCSSTIKWVAEYTVTSPLGLKVIA